MARQVNTFSCRLQPSCNAYYAYVLHHCHSGARSYLQVAEKVLGNCVVGHLNASEPQQALPDPLSLQFLVLLNADSVHNINGAAMQS